MFIVKAVRDSKLSNLGETYASFTCDYYEVGASTKGGCNAPDEPPYISPQREMVLYEKSQSGGPDPTVAHLDIGVADYHYCTVYIMNDRGRTIDTISARYPPPPSVVSARVG